MTSSGRLGWYANNMAGADARKNRQSKSKGKDEDKSGKPASAKQQVSKLAMCPDCSSPVNDDDEALLCDACSDWYHIACQGIEDSTYEFLQNTEDRGATAQFHWYCKKCNGERKGVGCILSEIKRLQASLSKQIEGLAELFDRREHRDAERFNVIEERLANLENKGAQENQDDLDAKMEEIINRKLADIQRGDQGQGARLNTDIVSAADMEAKATLKDLKDEEARKTNLILFRVPESDRQDHKGRVQEDIAFFATLCKTHLNIDNFSEDNIIKITRLGKKLEKRDEQSNGAVGGDEHVVTQKRPLLIKLDSIVTKMKILRNSSKLKDAPAEYRNVSVDHDLTPNQKKQQKELLAKAKDMESQDTTGNFKYRVRGSPGEMWIKKIQKT